MAAEGSYRPDERSLPSVPEAHGTTVTLTELKRKTPIDPTDLASSLARLYDYVDAAFAITVVPPDGDPIAVDPPSFVSPRSEEEYSWVLPKDLTDQDGVLHANGVRGRIIATRRPLRNTLRGITLYASGRMVDEPEFFGSSESSYSYSYLTGALDIDFIDNDHNDVIATDRRAVDWETCVTSELRSALQVSADTDRPGMARTPLSGTESGPREADRRRYRRVDLLHQVRIRTRIRPQYRESNR